MQKWTFHKIFQIIERFQQVYKTTPCIYLSSYIPFSLRPFMFRTVCVLFKIRKHICTFIYGKQIKGAALISLNNYNYETLKETRFFFILLGNHIGSYLMYRKEEQNNRLAATDKDANHISLNSFFF